MKGWIIGLIIVVILIIVGYLQTEGYLNFRWETLTIIFAALAAPFKLVTGMFKKPSDEIEEITKQHAALRAREEEYRKGIDQAISQRQQNISLLQKDIEVIDARLETLETRKAAISTKVSTMTSEQKKERFQELFGE